MKVIIAGTRTFTNYELLKEYCDYILSEQVGIEIVSGGAKSMIELATEKQLKVRIKLYHAGE